MASAGTATSSDILDCAAKLLSHLRSRAPKVHCITNTVAQPLTANILLAAGATPSLTTSEEEIGAFAGSADGVLVNLGTLDAERRRAIGLALDETAGKKVPWLLDPVFIDRSALRCDFARQLVARRPDVIRLNRAEFAALAGSAPTPDSVRALAKSCGCVVALTGDTDLVSDGERLVSLRNGHPLMGKVTAMGCAGSALATAANAVHGDAFAGAAAALLVFGVAGEIAAGRSDGPGSFAVVIIDAVHALTPDDIRQRGRIGDG